MKITFLFTFLMLISLNSFSQESNFEPNAQVTTYYFIRHAEKDRSNPSEHNPHLMQKGLDRAANWSKILGDVKFDAVYSTDYHRTKETAKPTADKNNVEITIYDPNKVDGDAFKKETKGKTILIVGHSNTIPSFVNLVIGQKKYKDIDDNTNGNLYIVTIIGNNIADQVLMIN